MPTTRINGPIPGSAALRPAALALAALLAVSCGGGGDDVAWALTSEPGGGDETGQGSSTNPGEDAGSAGSLALPVLVQEALPSGQVGVNRLAKVATFGMPFAEDAFISVDPDTGRPQLAVPGSPCFQFSTLKTWPSGDAQWVLVDVLTDVAAGSTTPLLITGGDGASSQPDLAAAVGDQIVIDTGPLQAAVSTSAFDLFETVVVDGITLVDDPAGPSLFGTDSAGGPLSLAPGAVVSLEENGPARCVVRAYGTLVDAADEERLDLTVRITARRASRALEVTWTLRNASTNRRLHQVVGSLGVATELVTDGTGTRVTFATPPGQANLEADLASGQQAFAYQSFSDATTTDIFSKDWMSPIDRVFPVNSGDPPMHFVEEGYQVQVDGADQLALGDAGAYPAHGFVDLRGPDGGVTLTLRRMPYLWPASLEADGDGRVTAGLFPERGPNDYTILWQQHESRSVEFAFHTDPQTSPNALAQAFDYPLSGRAFDYAHYDDSGVFAYRLVTEAEHEEALALMGLDVDLSISNVPLTVTRFLANSTTGGFNNSPSIETDLGAHWLRHGNGGSLLNGLDLALWKSEWQVRRSDDFTDDFDDHLVASNDGIPHTKRNFSDDEHRYRGGLVLAHYLTGDPRFRDALYDEAENLRGVDVWPHERSMYRTLIAMAHVIAFTGDTLLRDQFLLDRLAYFTEGIGSGGDLGVIDVCSDTSGAGWEGPPLPVGALTAGDRRYYGFSGDHNSEKPPGSFSIFGSNDTEYWQCRGFWSASYGPTAFFHAARVLDPDKPLHAGMHFNARSRMRDLSWWTRNELFPYQADPADRRVVYSYPICLQLNDWMETVDFHPILVGMAETFLDYRDAGLEAEGETFLQRGAEQLQGAQAHGQLKWFLTRLDCQHFMAIYREWALAL